MTTTVFFFSNAAHPLCLLSNFATARVVVRASDDATVSALSLVQPLIRTFLASLENHEAVFPTSEHVWQSLKALDLTTFREFTVSGRFGAWDSNVFVATKRGDVDKGKRGMTHWMRKDMLGIQAKLAANPKHGKALELGATKMNYVRERLASDVERTVWLAILRLKYGQNVSALHALRGTGAATHLVEFDRSGAKSHWGGCMRAADGKLVGENVMGLFTMEIRREFMQS
jgi:predicted NAD-dependent protein-ADP-ribosyltransferase YbiA (DUF1768 family)